MTHLVVIGLLGWVVRSVQFGRDQDCANPKHKTDD